MHPPSARTSSRAVRPQMFLESTTEAQLALPQRWSVRTVSGSNNAGVSTPCLLTPKTKRAREEPRDEVPTRMAALCGEVQRGALVLVGRQHQVRPLLEQLRA